MISKMILSSNELGCSEEILTIAAVLSVQVNCLIPHKLVNSFITFSDSMMITVGLLFLSRNMGKNVLIEEAIIAISYSFPSYNYVAKK